VKFVSIVGARPEFVQVGVLSKRLRERHEEITIHTGQHYDAAMSDVFFAELALPEPEIDLGIGSKPASAQTGEMLAAIAQALSAANPDAVIVRGDTNSTIAGAIAAKQALYPLVHIEAGCRSFDMTMPEEINRVTADHLADFNLATDDANAAHLAAEGVVEGVYVVGDVMYDTYLMAVRHLESAAPPSPVRLPPQPYDLLTLHRAENVDDRARLAAILAGFATAPRPVLFPAHPRTRKRIAEFGLSLPSPIALVEPLGYFDMLRAERGASTIFTDSGGVQREAYYGGIPCVTLRDRTEWQNTVDAGWNRLTGADTARIAHALAEPPHPPAERPPLFGDGDAAGHTLDVLESDEFRTLVASRAALRRSRV
jgi:UDP-N-acetylglucosamine 2-epimerase